MDILGANPIHLIYKINKMSVSVLLIVLAIYVVRIQIAIILLERDITIQWMKIFGKVMLINIFLDMPVLFIRLLFARSSEFLLFILQLFFNDVLGDKWHFHVLSLYTYWDSQSLCRPRWFVDNHVYCRINFCRTMLGEHPKHCRHQLLCQQALTS